MGLLVHGGGTRIGSTAPLWPQGSVGGQHRLRGFLEAGIQKTEERAENNVSTPRDSVRSE